MAVRFRIKTSAGQELSFATHEMFEDFVRSGDFSPEDLVYDSETGSWSPARTNPTVLDIQYEKEADAEAAATKEAEEEAATEEAEEAEVVAGGAQAGPAEQARPDDHASESDEGAQGQREEEMPVDLGLNLAPATEKSAEEASRDFVKKMEAERESDFDFGKDQAVQGFSMDDSSSMADMLAPAPPPITPEPTLRPVPDRSAPIRPQAADSSPDLARRQRKDVRREPRDLRGTTKDVRPETKKGGAGRKVMVGGIVIAVLGGGGYAGYRTLATSPEAPATDSVVPIVVEVPPEPEPEPEIASTVAAVRERAQERFLTATQAELRDLSPIPEAWPFGGYLSAPSEHSGVVETWEVYLATIRQVRSADSRRYRDAYESALDDALIADAARPERRAAATLAFARSADQRAAHFDRVEALATAAIQSHNALLEAEGLILFDSGGNAGGRDGLGAGAYGRDADAELLLTQVLDLLAGTLDADGLGPGDGASVREWVWDGFLDAVTANVAATNPATPTGVTN